MSELPNGWVNAALGEIVVNRDNQRVPVNANERSTRQGNVPYYGASGQVGWIDAAIYNERLLLLGEDGVQFFDSAKSKAYIIDGPSWVNNHAHVLSRAISGPSLPYLKYFLDQFDYRGYANGTTRLKLTRSAMDTVPVRLAPLAEQERIVTAIEEAFSMLDAGEASLRTTRQLLKRMREAVVASAVSGRLVHQDPADTPAIKLLADLGATSSPSIGGVPPAGWVWCELGTVTVLQQYGLSLKAHEVPHEGDVPMLRMGNLQGGVVSPSPLKYVHPDAEGVAQHLLSDGDVLFNRTNSAELVGKSAVYRSVPSPSTFASYLIRFRCAEGVLSSWCSTVVNSHIGRSYIDSVAVQQVGQANVNGSKLKRFPIPLPPADEQARIMAEVERQFSFIEACDRAVEAGLNRAAALRRSVLKAAFEGRLVTQDPDDEPASAMLERIPDGAGRRHASSRRRTKETQEGWSPRPSAGVDNGAW